MIDVELRGEASQIAVVRIDRPDRRNALDVSHCEGLRDSVDKVLAAGARVLVVTGVGTSFCAGADLDQVYGEVFTEALYVALHAICDAPVPVIAAVNGPAIGAGTQLALAADLRVVAPAARFGVPTARLGLAVDPWTLRRLTLLAGGGAARALVLGCETIDAERALAVGLAQRPGELDAALAWAKELAGLAPLTLSYSKLALNRALQPDPAGATGGGAVDNAVMAAFQACWASADAQEGRRARQEKRAPRFLGR